jgi:hypothetical protein
VGGRPNEVGRRAGVVGHGAGSSPGGRHKPSRRPPDYNQPTRDGASARRLSMRSAAGGAAGSIPAGRRPRLTMGEPQPAKFRRWLGDAAAHHRQGRSLDLIRVSQCIYSTGRKLGAAPSSVTRRYMHHPRTDPKRACSLGPWT